VLPHSRDLASPKSGDINHHGVQTLLPYVRVHRTVERNWIEVLGRRWTDRIVSPAEIVNPIECNVCRPM